ncbi:MAG: hypothetical protein P8X57_02155 [Cyclobacteriaceae bacterium]
MKGYFLLVIMCSILVMQACSGEESEQQIDCSASALEVEILSVDYTDCGFENGIIRVNGSGGTPPYTFTLDNGLSSDNGIFEELATNYYTVTVRDANNCSAQRQTFVGSNDGVRAVAFTTNSGCDESNGSIFVTARNGVEPYKYQLGENSDYTDSNEFHNLPAGNYSVWVRDANDCGIGIYVDVLSGVSYQETISGIFSSSCASTSCHGGETGPDLTTLDNIQDNSEAILSSIVNKTMPPDQSLSGDEIRKIECWIKDGTPDN